MAQVITLCSFGLDNVSLPPLTLVECTDAEATALIEARSARELLKNEPTEEQLATKFVIPRSEPPTEPRGSSKKRPNP
jgi:hypothetical protein